MGDDDRERGIVQPATTGPGAESWTKSVQITRALGLPITSVLGAIHLVRGWKAGAFDAFDLQSALEVAAWLVFVIYYPIHACAVWISKRVKAGKDVNSDASKIIPPAIVTSTINTVKRLTAG
jgi:hypothetical protein